MSRGLYIQSHVALRNHRKTRKLAQQLGVPLAQAVGHLHFLWWATIEYATDGDVTEWTEDDVAFYADWGQDPLEEHSTDAAGFYKALVDCGWIDQRGERAVMHDWPAYAGALVESRQRGKEAAKSGSFGNHKRWHVDRGVKDPECPHCRGGSPPESPPDSPPESGSESGKPSPRIASVAKRSVENSSEVEDQNLRASAPNENGNGKAKRPHPARLDAPQENLRASIIKAEPLWEKSLSHGGIVKLNKAHGYPVVFEAMQELSMRLSDGSLGPIDGTPYGYLDGMCRAEAPS